jgi:hypothetical protein
MEKPKVRYNRDIACFEVVYAGRVVYTTIDLDDAREYATLFV